MKFFGDNFNINPRLTLILAITALNCIFISCINAQSSVIRFERLGLEHGLSQNTVNCIYQDHVGFLWIGTNDGLNVYNGYDFKIYRADPDDSKSLNNNVVTAICEDPVDRNVIWIGTYDSGLSTFDRETQSFEHCGNAADTLSGLAQSRITSLFFDKDAILWIGTYRRGLYRYDRNTSEFIRYQSDPDSRNSLSSNSISLIFEDDSGVLWIGTLGGGLNKYDKETVAFTCFKNEPDNLKSVSDDRVKAICQDGTGGLWIGTEDGLNYFDPTSQLFDRFKHDPAQSTTISHNLVRTIHEDREGILWIGTENGLNIYDRENGEFYRYQNVDDEPESLSNNIITTIQEDRSDLIWIGTWGGGLNKYDHHMIKFRHYRAIPDVQNSLSFNSVSSFCEDSSGDLWIGTWGRGLNRFDRVKKQFTHYIPDPNNQNSLSDDVVFSLLEDRAGTLWIGTENGGLNRFNKETGTFTAYRHDPVNPGSLGGNTVVSIHESAVLPGVLWLATYGGGLNRFVIQDEQFTRFTTESGDLVNDFARILYEDSRGFLWIGTQGGISKFDINRLTFRHYQNQPDDSSSLSNNWVLSILEDHSGVMWIGTNGGGLNRFDPEKTIFRRYTEKSGLPNDVIYGILSDDDGNLWISTNRGLAKFDPEKETCRSYDVDNGMQGYEFVARACYKSKDGEMFFGGMNGYNAFYPDEVNDNPYVPPIVFTDFRIFNESVNPGKRVRASDRESPLTKPITETEEIVLSYKDNVFSFEFAALHFSSPFKNQFAYKMEGFDEDWFYAGTRNNVTYTNLDPGEYTMRVKGSNSDGIWNNEGASIEMVITPPFWQTWWFRISSGFCFLLVVFIWYKQRIRHIQNQKEKLEILVDEKTREIKETEAQLIQSAKMSVLGKLTASIAHEINNPIGTIMSNADVQIRCLDKLEDNGNSGTGPNREKLHRILRTNSEATLSASSRIAKIVQSLKSFTRMGDIAHDKMDVHEGLESVLTLLQYDISNEIDIKKYYGELPKIVCYPSEINQVFMTLLQNAYQSIEKQGTITISTSREEEDVCIKISDTGGGIAEEKLASLFELNFSAKGSRMGVGLGLPNAYNIIRKHRGKIQVKSTVGEGTQFCIVLPVIDKNSPT